MWAYGGKLYCADSSKRSVVAIEGDGIKEYGEGCHCHIIKLYEEER